MTKSKATKAAEARVRKEQEEARRIAGVNQTREDTRGQEHEAQRIDASYLEERHPSDGLRSRSRARGFTKPVEAILPPGYVLPDGSKIGGGKNKNKKNTAQQAQFQYPPAQDMGQSQFYGAPPQASNQAQYYNAPPQNLNQAQFFNPPPQQGPFYTSYPQSSNPPQYYTPPITQPYNQSDYHSHPQQPVYHQPLPQPTLYNQPVSQPQNFSPSPFRSPSPLLGPKPERRAATPSKGSGGVPEPTPEYLARTLLPTPRLPEAQHLLVIIDLNGTLLHRPSKTQPTKFVARPHTQRFLNYCIDTFSVVIWSSAKPDNVRHMCANILTPAMSKKVIAIWGRDKFGLTPGDYNAYTQCYKRLTKVWDDKNIAASHPESAWGKRWDQTNTVLIDDDNYKGRSEPYNLIEIPEFAGKMAEEKGDILPQVHDYLNKLSLHDNVSAYLRLNPWKAMDGPEGPPGYLQKGR